MNDYQKRRMLMVQENQARLRDMGIKNIAKSMISLAESKKEQKRKEKQLVRNASKARDADYVPDFVDDDSDENQEEQVRDNSICASQNGDIIMVNSDQEVLIVSVLLQREIFRHLDSATQVYNKDLIVPLGIQSDVIQKEKKKGLFSSMKKESKPKHEPEIEPGSAIESFEELSTLFSVANFPLESETREKHPTYEDEVELDIGYTLLKG